jgi:hypothetical protein
MSEFETMTLVLLTLPLIGKVLKDVFKLIIKLMDDRYKK